ncbi:MAG: glutathione S-transferase [Parvibaculum sp.]|nr:glutathione S-transferase [Parvibaculum sp.]
MRLYQMQDSGNCYKPRLLVHMTGRDLALVDIDILKGESRTPDFLAKNPNGRVPVLELEDGRLLAESNAMLFHLAQGTPYWPDDAFEQAQVLQWMFFEQYSHEPYIAVARYWRSIRPGGAEEARDRFPEWHDRGYQALDVMERQLAAQDWFVGTRMTIADIALYAYSHVAHEGGFSLNAYPAVRNWIARIEAQPLYVPMSWRPV